MNEEPTNGPPYILFYSYSHRDEEFRVLLEKQLVILRRSGFIREWHDRKILPGEEWDKQISKYLDAAKIILLLISPDFIASEYCYDVEAKRALERYDKGEVCLVPVILRPAKWDMTPFSKIQALPKNALPVTQWTDLDLAFVDVCEGIYAVVVGLKTGTFENLRAPQATPSAPPLTQARGFMSMPQQAKPHPPQKRVLDAALPERVAVEKTITLVSMIRLEDSDGLRNVLKVKDNRYKMTERDVFSSGLFPLDFPVDSEGNVGPLDLAIKIESPDFEPKTQTKTIRISPEGDSDLRIFLLKPKRLGDLFVNVELYKDDLLVSGCLLETTASLTEPEMPAVNLISAPLARSKTVEDRIRAVQSSQKLAVARPEEEYLEYSSHLNNQGDSDDRVNLGQSLSFGSTIPFIPLPEDKLTKYSNLPPPSAELQQVKLEARSSRSSNWLIGLLLILFGMVLISVLILIIVYLIA